MSNTRLLIAAFLLLILVTLCFQLAAARGLVYGDGFTLITLPILVAAIAFALILWRFPLLPGKPVKRGFAVAGLTLLLTAVWVVALWNAAFGLAQLGFRLQAR